MSDFPVGTIPWVDLAVPNAEGIRDFYEAVVGWTNMPISMGDYSDYSMMPPNSEQAVAGICHARGVNASLPPVWMVYIIVENLDASMETVRQKGGTILLEPRSNEPGQRFCVLRDPAGAIAALYEAG